MISAGIFGYPVDKAWRKSDYGMGAIEYREAGGYPISDEELEKDIEKLIGDLRKKVKITLEIEKNV